MTVDKLRLHVADGPHITQPRRRIKEIEERFGDVDVVFVESALSNPPKLRTRFVNTFAVPLILVGLYVWVGLLAALGKLTGRSDQQVAEYLQAEHGARIVLTDRNVHNILAEGRLLWAASHYLIVITTIFGLPFFALTQFQFLPLQFRIAFFTVLLSAGLFGIFAAGTLGTRNAEMAHKIEKFAEQSDATSACLLTGAAHGPGVKRQLELSEKVEVLS